MKKGLKHADDQHDAFFLAHLLILGILPQGYIYPKKDRPVRDLARQRMFLVQHMTAHVLSRQSLIVRCCAKRVSSNQMRNLTLQDLQHLLEEEHLVLSAQANLDSIRFLTQQIKGMEKTITKRIKLNQAFQNDDHYAGGRRYQSFCQGGKFCLLLPLCIFPALVRWQK
jgi:hypothetical protein